MVSTCTKYVLKKNTSIIALGANAFGYNMFVTLRFSNDDRENDVILLKP